MLWLPVAVGLLCFVVPWRSVPLVAVVGTLATLGLAVALVAGFHSGDPGLQHTVDESWIPDLGVRYQLGIDGISVFLVLLTALLWAGATAFSVFRMPDRRRIYFFMLGLGYGHPKWAHGLNHGGLAVEREDIVLNDVDVHLPHHLHIQALCDVTCREADGRVHQGRGVLEQLAMGPHAPSGFKTMDFAP